MIKKMGYRWRLRQVMASREMYATTAPLVRRVGLAGVLTVRHPLLCGEWWSAQITQLGAPVTAREVLSVVATPSLKVVNDGAPIGFCCWYSILGGGARGSRY